MVERPDNPVRALHNAVARAPTDIEASTRPASTDPADLARMVDDVMHKLDVEPGSEVVEIGCGTGILGLPIARAAKRYVGVDFAHDALAVLRERLVAVGVGDKATLVELDVLRATDEELGALGTFDRLLVYATFHYVTDEAEARRFLARIASLLAPGGRALVGNLPLTELATAVAPLGRGSIVARSLATARWVADPRGQVGGLGWRIMAISQHVRRRHRAATDAAAPAVVEHRLVLSRSDLDRWVDELDEPIARQWLAPAVGTPMHLARADLILTRPAAVPESPRGGVAIADATVSAAGRRLAVPEGCTARLLTEPQDRAAVVAFLEASPDAVLGHQPGWIDFLSARGRRSDVLLVERDGQPQVAIPVTWIGRWTIDVGYRGLVFPAGPGEHAHKRAVRTLRALLDANPQIGLRGAQSGQSQAYDDPDRAAVLAAQLEAEHLAGPSLWCRVLDRDPSMGGFDLEADEAALFKGYEAKLRSQIRQARRNGLVAEVHVPGDDAEGRRVAEEVAAVHVESWGRTGLRPHGLGYWVAMSAGARAGGGREVTAFVRDSGGVVVATVTCHVFGDRAVYLSGGSRTSGRDARANPLCLHTAILECFRIGVTHFELGRFSATETSEKEITITRYKSQFGGRLFRLTTVATPRTRRQWASEQAFRLRRKVRIRLGGDFLYV